MLKLFTKSHQEIWGTVKQWFFKERRVLLTASGVAGAVILVRSLGLLQPWELAVYDQFIRVRPPEPRDNRIVIVGIDEGDLQKFGFPIPDGKMAELLQKIAADKPLAIGVDLFRDLPIPPGDKAGDQKLHKAWETIPNLIGIEELPSDKALGVNPPAVLNQKDQVGFNNIIKDIDNKVRRGLLYQAGNQGSIRTSFALKLSLIYLENQGIEPKPAGNSQDLQLGKAVFERLRGNEGAYVNADAGGYQFLANLRGPKGTFSMVSMNDIFLGKVPREFAQGRIVLIGSTATSVKDLHSTSYSTGLFSAPKEVSGVELHANFISQILSSAIEGRTTIKVWPNYLGYLWIWGWSIVGALISWKLQSSRNSVFCLLGISIGLSGISYLVLLWDGWWLPLIPPLMGMAGSSIVIMSYLARLQEELKRSKDFLQTVINTIPDPVFVKDKDHRQIVLNKAYCRLTGYSLEQLLAKTDYDLFSPDEAKLLWEQDERVFHSNEECENEEKLTDAKGVVHDLETKRSLHQDAAGNKFLVGVMRDITERKRLEEELKQANAALRQGAYHDPLTGLPNRTLFADRLNQAIEMASTNHRLVALLFLDLDGFKLINDTLGHDIGDLLLKGVAQRLQGSLRESDTISRLGGDEFTVILPGIPGLPEASAVAEKILNAMTEPFNLNGNIVAVTTSIGISLYPLDAQDIDTLIKHADAAMYRAKDLGKNRYEFS
jgi:diguanylate cyclase (GGDEF)-like protein/PAS domain S-box-containing protein